MRGAAGVVHLAASVDGRAALAGTAPAGKDDDGVGAAGSVDISRVAAEAEAGIDGRDPADRGAGRYKVDVDGARAVA